MQSSGLSGLTSVGLEPSKSASSGADEFSDFQGGGVSTGGDGGAGKGGGDSAGRSSSVTNGGSSGVNAKWRDVSSLVDLGGLTSNSDKKVRGGGVGRAGGRRGGKRSPVPCWWCVCRPRVVLPCARVVLLFVVDPCLGCRLGRGLGEFSVVWMSACDLGGCLGDEGKGAGGEMQGGLGRSAVDVCPERCRSP